LIINFFIYTGLATKGYRETSARSIEESSPKKSSSLVVVDGRAKEVMKDYPIIIDELSILKETTMRVKTLTENEVKGSRTLLTEGQVDLSPPEMITSVATHFKRKRVSTLVEPDVLILIVEAHMITFSLL